MQTMQSIEAPPPGTPLRDFWPGSCICGITLKLALDLGYISSGMVIYQDQCPIYNEISWFAILSPWEGKGMAVSEKLDPATCKKTF